MAYLSRYFMNKFGSTAGVSSVSQAYSGWFWCGVEQFSQQGLRMVVSLLLARLLPPETFGIVASVMIFLTMAQNLIDGGIGSRIIQKNNIHDDDYTALFWCNGVVSVICCGSLVLSSGVISSFYGNSELKKVVVVMSIVTFFMTSGKVQQCQLIRELRFKTNALISAGSVMAGSITGIVLALFGGGVWAILGQQLVSSIVQALTLWILLPWRPGKVPRWENIKDLYSFGIPVMTSQTIRSGAEQVINVFTAKFVSLTQLGFLDRGCFIPNNVCVFLQNIFFRTNFTIISRLQKDPVLLRETYMNHMTVFISLLLVGMSALAVSAPVVIEVLIGANWLPATFLFQAGCVMSALQLLFQVHVVVLKAIGRVNRVFHQNLVCAILQVTGVVIGLYWSLTGMVFGVVVARILSWFFSVIALSRSSSIKLRDELYIILRPLPWMLGTILLLGYVRRLGLPLLARFLLCGLSGLVMLVLCWFVIIIKVTKTKMHVLEKETPSN